jgi:Fe-S-cluster containining protein
MEIDLIPFFKKYEVLSAMADGLFERIKKEYPECVKCKTHCSDCCHALFDLTLIEALYINHHFRQSFEGKEKERLIAKANRADRQVYKIKKKAHKDSEAGKNTDDILTELAKERVRCPLLNEQEVCDLYAYRPITCRLYGIPTSIGGAVHTCGMSGFVQGKQYPTVKLEKIQTELYRISAELVKAIASKYVRMADMLVPLSMALLTVYDDEYLGITDSKKAHTK